MDILFITLSPIDATFSMSFRNRAVIFGFVELGYNVDVLTIDSYDSSIQIKKINFISKINIIRLNSGTPKVLGKLSIKQGNKSIITKFIRSIYHRVFPFDSSFSILRSVNSELLTKKKYDFIISSSDPKTSHLVVKRLLKGKLKYERWIQYWGDPLARDITSKLIYPKKLIIALEKWLLKGANKIIYVSPITLVDQQKFFSDFAPKMTFLPIPYEKVKLYPETDNKIYTIGYFGFYLKSVRNILPLYNAVKNSSENIRLNIIGPSDMKLENHSKVTIHPNTSEIETFEVNADLMVVILNLHGGQIPGKLYHLAATNKPVLVILDGDFKEKIREYLKSFNRFIFCENNEASISKAINDFLVSNKTFEPCQQLSPISIARQFLQ